MLLLSCVHVLRRKKEAVPEYHEEIVKIVFLGKTILRFEKIEETRD